MPTTQTDIIRIGRPPETVYGYVTQPWRWHEWHPNSRSAGSTRDELEVGDTFDERIELRPLSPLPLTLRRTTSYEVVAADPPRRWAVRGTTRDGWLEIDYQLQPDDAGTLFTRILTYQARGLTGLLMPLLKRRVAEESRVALDNLRFRLESNDDV